VESDFIPVQTTAVLNTVSNSSQIPASFQHIWLRIVMEYPSAKFGDFSFSRFGFIVRTDRQNHRVYKQTKRFTEADDRYTHAPTIGVSNK